MSWTFVFSITKPLTGFYVIICNNYTGCPVNCSLPVCPIELVFVKLCAPSCLFGHLAIMYLLWKQPLHLGQLQLSIKQVRWIQQTGEPNAVGKEALLAHQAMTHSLLPCFLEEFTLSAVGIWFLGEIWSVWTGAKVKRSVNQEGSMENQTQLPQ